VSLVTLVDGRQVSSDSHEWKIETLARFIVDIPGAAKRQEWLEGFDRRLGVAATNEIRDCMEEIRKSRKAA
jgi:hypothetical protein